MIIYEGPSLLDGSDIVVVATKKSNNSKTGNMVQTWILRADMYPSEAIQQGLDSSICGECPARPIMKKLGKGPGDCYVTMMGPNAVFRTYKSNKYPKAKDSKEIASFGKGRVVRLGAYGDPAAVPVEVWKALVSKADGYTGYTHQWRNTIASKLKELCMASCDSYEDRVEAVKDGWRTFRVVRDTKKIDKGEFRCPSDPLLSTSIPCFKCKACDGFDVKKPQKGSPFIVAHGYRSKAVQKKTSKLVIL